MTENGYAGVISQLERQKAAIDKALEALLEIGNVNGAQAVAETKTPGQRHRRRDGPQESLDTSPAQMRHVARRQSPAPRGGEEQVGGKEGWSKCCTGGGRDTCSCRRDCQKTEIHR